MRSLFKTTALIALTICCASWHEVSAFTQHRPQTGIVSHQQRRGALSMAADPEAKKETTWDRITGPKLFKTVTNWNGIHSVPLVPLRILTGLLMIHHGSEGKKSLREPTPESKFLTCC